MNLITKAYLFKIVLFIAIYLIIYYLAKIYFKNVNGKYIAVIVAVITALLAPQMKKVETQSGDKIQIKWIFSKKTILI